MNQETEDIDTSEVVLAPGVHVHVKGAKIMNVVVYPDIKPVDVLALISPREGEVVWYMLPASRTTKVIREFFRVQSIDHDIASPGSYQNMHKTKGFLYDSDIEIEGTFSGYEQILDAEGNPVDVRVLQHTKVRVWDQT